MRQGRRRPGAPDDELRAAHPDPTGGDVENAGLTVGFGVGLDRGGGAHAVCVHRESGALADRFAVGHGAAGLRPLQRRLARCAMPAGLRDGLGDGLRDGLRDGRIVMSFPRAGQICAAAMLAERDDGPARYRTADQRAADAGLGPVTCQSGESRRVGFRSACNRPLRAAFTGFADNSRPASQWAADICARARARGRPRARG